MSSVSSTSSSLGNTALRGFGGLASGIDRDALIEQMTARTTSKITSKKQAMTKLEWKRDAYRSISNKIIDLQDPKWKPLLNYPQIKKDTDQIKMLDGSIR